MPKSPEELETELCAEIAGLRKRLDDRDAEAKAKADAEAKVKADAEAETKAEAEGAAGNTFRNRHFREDW